MLFWTVCAAAQTPPTPQLPRIEGPGQDEVLVMAVKQAIDGPIRRLRGQARVETTEMVLRADEIDYDTVKGYAEARGNVQFDHFVGGEHIEADKVEYNLAEQTGKYYNVRGSAPAKVDKRPGVLTTSAPFSFHGKWAERLKDRYILHDGFITNCKLPKPWWVLRGSTFDVIPGQRAIARDSVFWVKRIPLFYTPYFYKALSPAPRKSGLLTPNIGNSSRRGKMIGAGYYWAINRSYDASYRAQLFTQRGIAHHVDLRGKPTQESDFNFILYGVSDRGLRLEDGSRRKEGGYIASFIGQADTLPFGFHGRADINYLSSFTFRQAFTESFFEAVHSEVHSTAFAQKHWSSYTLTFVGQRSENFQSTQPNDKVSIRKLPAAEFQMRDRQIGGPSLPVWVSFSGSGGFMRRNQLLFQTRQYVDRLDVEPRIMTALRWKGFSLLPSFSVRETHYGSSFDEGQITGQGLWRHSREFHLEFSPPALQRIYNAPRWIGERLKHVIEPRAFYRHVSGVDDFDRIVRFDETELISNTSEAQIGITNRLLAKKGGRVHEVLTLEVFQRRFFDPDFGGAVVAGRRNVIVSTATLTGFTFLDGPRHYSPVVSTLRISPAPNLGFQWRTDYDPLRGKVVNSGLTMDAKWSKYLLSLGHNQVSSTRVLSPSANQMQGLIGIGEDNRKGWSAAFSGVYDYREAILRFATTQISYNTDCCGISVQYRRFGFGTRNENQFRIAFVVANIGSFGTLKRQERIF